MKTFSSCLFFAAWAVSAHAETSLTIYNQNFGVVRDTVPLDLQPGINQVRFADTTAHLEPDSVILRDPTNSVKLSILEQNYRADPISSGLLLSLNEGREIEFFVKEANKPDRIVKGKVIRSGYTPHDQAAMQRYGNQYYQSQMAMTQATSQPVIEVEGQLQFSLPGEPRFPALADDTILKPSLDWRIHADKAAKLNAELCYVTGGMSWEADYNVVAPENGEVMDLTGWVTVDNQSGRTFKEAKLQLVAGDVAKIQGGGDQSRALGGMAFDVAAAGAAPQVTEKAFDEYHLYSLPLPTTLHDRETKQVEFVRAAGVKSQRLFIYDGVQIDQRYRGWGYENIRQDESYGTQSNPKVWVMREIKNSEDNHLGMPLPKGKIRFYRQEGDRLQFTGEDVIDHTPRDETLRLRTGNAFDLVGERKRMNFRRDDSNHWLDESFEIKVRNRKQTEAVEIRVVEHLYRWTNWEVREPSNPFVKNDAQTIEFRIPLKAGEEKAITYTVHYSW